MLLLHSHRDMASAGALVFAGKSVVAPVIKEIITKAFRYLDGYFNSETMEEMKNKLDEGMVQIQVVLDVVRPDYIKDKTEALDQWFWNLRDAVEGAEDAIDELEYHELKEKAKEHMISEWGSLFAKVKHKVVKSVKYGRIFDKSVKHFSHRGTLKRLKKAIEGIDKAAAGATIFLEVIKFHQGETFNRSWQEGFVGTDRQTGSTSTVTKFVGREKEKKQILEWLTKKTRVEDEAEIVINPVHVPIFSLVGHGGMGKTTLAQTICENDEVVKDFKIIWVTVSTRFDATSVTRKILESVNGETLRTDSLEPLQQALKDNMKTFNRFFLILDDVWEEEKRSEWEKLFAPLRTMKGGNKILLTTRMASVAATAANVMGVAIESLTLEELQEDHNLELFNHHVFSGLKSQDYGELRVIGERIARKLGGCPLVTKVVSGHLQGNMTSEFWDRFLCEDYLNDFKGNTDDIMKVLNLSYYYLPTELQTCFRYCSIFPKDYKFTKKELVMMWIGSGLISPTRNEEKRLEDIGEHYISQLTRKSFFEQKIEKHQYSQLEREYYVMHDLIHELADYVSSGECKRITSPGRFADVKDTVRHLSIDNIDGLYADRIKRIVNLKNLRTLIISEANEGNISKHMACAIENALENSRALRLIQMNNGSPFSFPRKTDKLKHLRGIFVNALAPESIKGILRLYPLMFPVSKLTYLQELGEYQVQGIKGNKIIAIRDLKYLRELEVWGLQNLESIDEARSAKLKEKNSLISLSLWWPASYSGTQNRIDDLVVDQLEPHANIKKLTIHGYRGLRPPFWMDNDNLTVKKLVSLRLEECLNWEQLPYLQELELLRHLTLLELPKLQQIGPSSHMSGKSTVDMYLPPNLYSLRVEKCLELKELPILPTSLAYLKLIHVGLTYLPTIGKLHNCPKMRMLGGEKDVILSSLARLSLGHTAQGLVSLPSADVCSKNLKSLRTLLIRGCDHLISLGGLGSIPSLSSLEITQCCKLVEAARFYLSGSYASAGEEEHLVVPQLEYLRIDLSSLLLVEPLKSIHQTQQLIIEVASETESYHERWLLRNCASLKFMNISKAELLPQSMKDLSSLQNLTLFDAGKLDSLPDLPLSLQNLYINICHPDLKKKIRAYGSPEWDKISHVPRLQIGPSSWFVNFLFPTTEICASSWERNAAGALMMNSGSKT
ncbi:hypothetical protein EJB05_08579, partial [Eragrostis curvula]